MQWLAHNRHRNQFADGRYRMVGGVFLEGYRDTTRLHMLALPAPSSTRQFHWRPGFQWQPGRNGRRYFPVGEYRMKEGRWLEGQPLPDPTQFDKMLPAPQKRIKMKAKAVKVPPSPGQKEHQVSFSLAKSLREDSDRDLVRNLLNQVANAVDGDASHIQVSLRVVVPAEAKDKIVNRAEEAGIPPSVTDL